MIPIISEVVRPLSLSTGTLDDVDKPMVCDVVSVTLLAGDDVGDPLSVPAVVASLTFELFEVLTSRSVVDDKRNVVSVLPTTDVEL